jgi:hypothetical protein
LEDFNALAVSLGHGMADVRGCLILSRDGLVLGAHPAESERTTTRAWIRFATIGDPERGFAQFGTETWCYVRRGPYAGFAVAGPGVRPGLVIDHMEQVLLAAEASRSRHEGLRGTEAATVAPQSKPRSYLHPEDAAPDPLVIDAPALIVARPDDQGFDQLPLLPTPGSGAAVMPANDGPQTAEPQPDAFARFLEPPADPPPPASELEPEARYGVEPAEPEHDVRQGWEHEPTDAPKETPMSEPWSEPVRGSEDPPGQPAEPGDEGQDEEEDVDRFSLAREFGQLLQGGEDPADG